MDDDNIRPPDKVKVMCLANFDDDYEYRNENDYDFEEAVKQSLQDIYNNNDENDTIYKILEESRKEYELMQQVKEMEEEEKKQKEEEKKQKEEQKKQKEEEKKQKEEEKKQKEEEIQLEKRKKEFETLQPKIKKMITYDQTNKSIYEVVLLKIDLYINRKKDFVSLDKTMIDQIFNLLKGIRLTSEEITNIKKIFVEL
jgi:hypothetical protein